uniref:Myb/SANT-like domain-containing protein n=1 Tax=Psilocybe cubensis TaxID=181762 RepID=A0A8H8CH26_PSICU
MSLSASWTAQEELSFMKFLVDYKAEAGDDGSFKSATFQKAALHIGPFHKRKAIKNAKSCMNKYSMFCKIYRIIHAI